ncbi:MAG TPA: YkvA family protein [Feifaniaceae bacterium]|nr:YkvA family protein [Feifaniaceae bacterium]
MTVKERAGKLKTDIPAVFLALRKKETPALAKICAGVTVAYALSPIDLVPDFIPVLGYLDDVLILPGLVALTIRLIPEDIFARCRAESEGLWRDGKPKKWYYALPILAVWLILPYLIIKEALSR